MTKDIIVRDLNKKSKQLTRNYRISLAYIGLSLIPIAVLSSIFEPSHFIMQVVVKIQIYSALIALIYCFRCKYILRKLVQDKEDINSILFYNDVYDEVLSATFINDSLVSQDRKITVYEALKYAKFKNKK